MLNEKGSFLPAGVGETIRARGGVGGGRDDFEEGGKGKLPNLGGDGFGKVIDDVVRVSVINLGFSKFLTPIIVEKMSRFGSIGDNFVVSIDNTEEAHFAIFLGIRFDKAKIKIALGGRGVIGGGEREEDRVENVLEVGAEEREVLDVIRGGGVFVEGSGFVPEGRKIA
jgi:hypothetical protein